MFFRRVFFFSRFYALAMLIRLGLPIVSDDSLSRAITGILLPSSSSSSPPLRRVKPTVLELEKIRASYIFVGRAGMTTFVEEIRALRTVVRLNARVVLIVSHSYHWVSGILIGDDSLHSPAHSKTPVAAALGGFPSLRRGFADAP